METEVQAVVHARPDESSKPPTILVDRLEAAELSGIPLQVRMAKDEIVAWKVSQHGLRECNLMQVAVGLSKPHHRITFTCSGKVRWDLTMLNTPRYIALHAPDGCMAWIAFRTDRRRSFWESLRANGESWETTIVSRVAIGPVDKLAMPMPTGVLLKIAELKDCFEHFVAVAPSECFVQPQPLVDPIVLGVTGSHEAARFFEIARW